MLRIGGTRLKTSALGTKTNLGRFVRPVAAAAASTTVTTRGFSCTGRALDAQGSPETQNSGSSKGPSRGSSSSVAVLLSALVASGLTFAGTKYYLDNNNTNTTSNNPAGQSINHTWTTPKYGGLAEFQQAYPELLEILGQDRVSTDKEDLERHGFNEWTPATIAVSGSTPIAIVYPTSTEEVSRIAKICHKYRLPMIGFSGGSSIEGNFSAPRGGICFDFNLMNKIIEVRPDDMDATVQPAVGWVELNRWLKSHDINLFFGVDPAPIAKIGGMVSTSCSGTNCVKYGPMRDHVVNMTVVLADGSIIKTRQRPRKSSAGYNLNHLFCGSEGTLGLITEITIKLQVAPENTKVAICPFPSVKNATDTAIQIIRAGVPLHCVELMDDVQMWAVNNSGYTSRKWSEEPTLFFKFSGTEHGIQEQIEKAQEIAKKNDGTKFEFARDEKEGEQLWSARKEALWSSMALGPKNGKVYTTDVAVPMSKLAELILATKEDIKNSGVAYGSAIGHVGDGNFHATLIYNDTPEEEAAAKQVAKNVVYRGLQLDGTCSGEHGVGISKIDYLVSELGPDTIDLMHTIKLALDPYELLNPGKLFTKEAIETGRQRVLDGTSREYYPFPPKDNETNAATSTPETK